MWETPPRFMQRGSLSCMRASTRHTGPHPKTGTQTHGAHTASLPPPQRPTSGPHCVLEALAVDADGEGSAERKASLPERCRHPPLPASVSLRRSEAKALCRELGHRVGEGSQPRPGTEGLSGSRWGTQRAGPQRGPWGAWPGVEDQGGDPVRPVQAVLCHARGGSWWRLWLGWLCSG